MRQFGNWMLVVFGLALMVSAAANDLPMHSFVGALHAAVGIVFLTRTDNKR